MPWPIVVHLARDKKGNLSHWRQSGPLPLVPLPKRDHGALYGAMDLRRSTHLTNQGLSMYALCTYLLRWLAGRIGPACCHLDH